MARVDQQGQMLTVGQVARRCGVSVDTVRAWSRSGQLPSSRTAGGQRRFREADVAALAGMPAANPPTRTSREGHSVSRVVPPVSQSEKRAHRARSLVIEDPMVLEARTQLEVTRAEAERDALARQVQAGERQLEREMAAEHSKQAEATRLEGLKAYGRSLGADLPIAWFSTLTSDLEGFVHASNVPAALPPEQARALIAGRVQLVRRQFQTEESQRLRAVLDETHVMRLKAIGQSLVRTRTLYWDSRESEMARSLARRELDAQVESDWTESDVRTLVEDVLSDWDDDDDPGYDDDVLEDGDLPEEDDADLG